MLPSRNRLNLAHTDKKIGIRLNDKELTLVYTKKPGKLKAAVIVSKKVAKLAVDRNRIRRTITEALSAIDSLEGEIVVIAKKNIKSAKSTIIKARLVDLINKIK